MYYIVTLRVVMVGEMNEKFVETSSLIPDDACYDDAISYSYGGWNHLSVPVKKRIESYLRGTIKGRVPFKEILIPKITYAVSGANITLEHYKIKMFKTAAPQVVCYCFIDTPLSLDDLRKQHDKLLRQYFRAGDNNVILENIRIVKSLKYTCFK